MNEPNEVCSRLSEKGRKGRGFLPDKLENYTSDGKGREKKKERGGRKEKRRKQWLHFSWLLDMGFGSKKRLCDGKGPFGGNVFKTPANFTLTRI